MHQIGVIGSVTIDRNVRGVHTSVRLGGVVAYAGLTFRRHGLATTAVTNVARSDGRLLDLLRNHGIEFVVGETATTTRFVNRLEGDARRQEMPAQASPIMAKQALAILDAADHIHLGPLHPGDLGPDLYPLVGKSRATVSLDIQGCVRQIVGGRVIEKASDILSDALHSSDYVKADRGEYDLMLDALEMDVAALMDEFSLREVLVTQGMDGGFVVERSGNVTPYAAVQVLTAADSTGAGDVFMAAYLIFRLHERRTVAESSRYAAEVAARQVAGTYITEADLRIEAASP